MIENASPASKSELSVENHTDVRKRQFTFGSLFAGIGGMDLGLERAGMTCKWQVEIDPFCQKVLAKHWPGVKRYGDITKLTGNELGPVDLICGGFPCQDVSLAGLRKGIGAGTRSGLYADMLRIVSVLRPTYVLMENVAGLLIPGSSDEPAPISRVLGDLAEIGFDAEWQSIPAAAFGSPHIRDRVFIVAYTHRYFGDDGKDITARLPQLQGRIFHTGKEEQDPRLCITSGYPADASWWHCEPGMDRVADGVPAQMDRLRVLGNAVVPQVAEWIGKRILSTLKVRGESA